MRQYLKSGRRYRPKLLLMTVYGHLIDTKVDDHGWPWIRWRTAATVFKYLNQHNPGCVQHRDNHDVWFYGGVSDTPTELRFLL